MHINEVYHKSSVWKRFLSTLFLQDPADKIYITSAGSSDDKADISSMSDYLANISADEVDITSVDCNYISDVKADITCDISSDSSDDKADISSGSDSLVNGSLIVGIKLI